LGDDIIAVEIRLLEIERVSIGRVRAFASRWRSPASAS